MKISEKCLEIIERWEGLKLDAYLDPVGIPTIGYGTIAYPNGQKVRLGDQISEAEAEAFLISEVNEMVEDLHKILDTLTLGQNQFDAVVSLCYNIGIGAFQGSSVLARLRDGDFAGASAAFDLWNKGTIDGVKVVLPGLVNRRRDERTLFEAAVAGGTPIDQEESKQDRVVRLEGFREGANNVIVARSDDNSVVEILVLNTDMKEDLVSILRQYKNARSFDIAPAGDSIPAGDRMEIAGKNDNISVAKAPALDRSLLVLGVRDDDPNTTGDDVKELQRRLQDLGYYKRELDGIFGRATDAAVRDFQADVFGVAQADGKVGKITWASLWGNGKTASGGGAGSKIPGKNYLKLTRTGTKESSGCFRLKLTYFKDGKSKDFINVVSGEPTHQRFRKGLDSIPKTSEPLPEGKWFIHDVEWAGGKDVYNSKLWADGIGPAKIRLDYVPENGTRRSNIEIHIDWNKATLPGTAGCIGVNSIADYKKLVSWLNDSGSRDLFVDWNLGSVEI